jgi:hypothetical protein
MRYLKLGAAAAIVVVVAIALLRLTDVITAAQAPWLYRRALAGVALLTLALAAIGLVSARGAAQAPDRPIP